MKHGAAVNASDLWAFTPLHEGASKSRAEVCSLLLSEGADPTQLNCHSKSAIDVAPTLELQGRLACKCFCKKSKIISTVTLNFRENLEFKNNYTYMKRRVWLLRWPMHGARKKIRFPYSQTQIIFFHKLKAEFITHVC